MKTKTIPFDIEIAKKIQAGKIKGKIKYAEGDGYAYDADILKFDLIADKSKAKPNSTLYRTIVAVIEFDNHQGVRTFNTDGYGYNSNGDDTKLFIEVPEETPEEQHPIEESELYQAGYKVGFEAGRRCVAFDEEKGCAIKGETPKHDFIVGELVKIISGRYSGRRGTIEEIIEEPLTSINRAKVSIDENTHPYFPFEYLERCSVGSKEETSKHEFKPFDKVLVRDNCTDAWRPRLYDKKSNSRDWHFCQDGHGYNYCIPYEGNEHLVGTTDKPKEIC